MFHSKSQRNKKIIQTEDERIFYIAVNPSKDDLSSQTPQKTRDSVPTSLSSKPSLLKKKSPEEYKIGNYLIEETLGEGTFGKVKLGKYLPNDEKVAIKILEKKRMTNTDDHIRLKREFDMINEFNHPNVILVHEIFETNEKYYCVMEYCEGGELFHYIVKKKRLTEKESAFLFFQLINGLEYIHSLGIVHRDLKPENLLLSKEHLLKIIDFGLSNYFKENQTELLSTACGSPCYASPEMVSGKKYDGIKIDIWASGIILFAMINGYLPFEDDDNEVLFDKILECKIVFPEYMSEESIDLIKKILVVDPEKRITIPEIKKHPFFITGKNLFYSVFTIKPINEEQEKYNNDNKAEVVNNNEEENNNELNDNKVEKINNGIQYENELKGNKENINLENEIEYKNGKNNSVLNKNNVSRNSKKDKNIIKKEDMQKNMKNNKRSKDYNKERRISHNKINIIDNTPFNNKNNIKNISEIKKKSKNNILRNNRTEENKNTKVMRLKEKEKIGKIRNNLLIDAISKERNTIGSIASIGSSNETINNISQQTNITNNMPNIVYNYTSFYNKKRTYNENVQNLGQPTKTPKNNIIYTLPNNNNLNNQNEIQKYDTIRYNNNNYKFNNNTIETTGYLFNHFSYNYNYVKRRNIINKIRNNNHTKNQKILNNKKKTSSKFYNSNFIKKLREGTDFNICKLINDITIKNNYRESLNKLYEKNTYNKNFNSQHTKKLEKFYTDKTDHLKINTNNTKIKNKSKKLLLNNINSIIKYKKLNIITPNLLNKNNYNKKINQTLKVENVQYQPSGENNTISLSLKTEKKSQNKINKKNTENDSKIYQSNDNKKSNPYIKTCNNQKNGNNTNPQYKGKIRHKIIKYKINQLFNSSNIKEKEHNKITNNKTNNPNFISISNTYNTYLKNISNIKPKNSKLNNKKAQTETKIVPNEKITTTILINNDKDSFFKPIKNKFIQIESSNKKEIQNICSISNINNISNTDSKYIKVITPNESNSKSKKKLNKNENLKPNLKKIPNRCEKNLLKLNKFKKICHNNNSESKRKYHIKTLNTAIKVNTNHKDNIAKLKRNKLINNISNNIKHKVSNSSRIQNNNLPLPNEVKNNHHKNVSSKIKESNNNNIKTKLIKVYLADTNKTINSNDC